MRRDSVNYALVGAFVLAMLALAVAALYLVTGRTGPVDRYQVVYERLAGLGPGTPVRYEGYPVGRVEAIEPERAGGGMRYRVTLSVREGWPIPADSVAEISASGLLAQLTIDIREGQAERLLEPGGTLAGRAGGDLAAVLSGVATDMNALARDSLAPLLRTLNAQLAHLGDDLEAHGPAIVKNTRSLVDKLNGNATRLERALSDANLARLERMLADAAAAAEQAAVAAENGVAISEEGRRVAARLAAFSRDLEATRSRADALLAALEGVVGENRADLAASVDDLRRVLHVAARHSERIAHHVEGTSRNMHELSRQLRQNPGLLLGTSPPRDPAP